MSHVLSVIGDETRELSYKIYVTRQLRAMASGKTIVEDWYNDIVNARDGTDMDGQAIAREVIGKAGLVVRHEPS